MMTVSLMESVYCLMSLHGKNIVKINKLNVIINFVVVSYNVIKLLIKIKTCSQLSTLYQKNK